MWSALYPISNHSHIRQLQFATHAFSQQVLQQAVQISICQCIKPIARVYTRECHENKNTRFWATYDMTDNEFNLEFNKELLYYRENVVATVYITI